MAVGMAFRGRMSGREGRKWHYTVVERMGRMGLSYSTAVLFWPLFNPQATPSVPLIGGDLTYSNNKKSGQKWPKQKLSFWGLS